MALVGKDWQGMWEIVCKMLCVCADLVLWGWSGWEGSDGKKSVREQGSPAGCSVPLTVC